MSTNYYLVNKVQKAKKKKWDEFLESELNELKRKLNDFNTINEIGIEEEEINCKIAEVTNNLEYGLLEVEEIDICNTSNILVWKITEHYKNYNEFVKYYETVKDEYNIEDEYGEVFTLEAFKNKITFKNQEVKYLDFRFRNRQ